MRVCIGLFSLAILFSACSPNNVTIKDSWSTYFQQEKVEGTFGLFDNGKGEFLIYNLSRFRDSAYQPASTFKIVNSLIALKTGRIADENHLIPWDGIVRVFPNGDTAKSWNKDLTMAQAFKESALPYYQEVARRIGRDTMQAWLDTLQYGNHTIGNKVDEFWIDNSLKVKPDEQLGLVKKLYFEQLPFDKRSQRIVKEMMWQEKNANYQMAYKTGWGFKENGKAIGWMVGWIEENKHPYFFVLNIEGPNNANMSSIRKNIVQNILKEMGFFEGKK